MSTDMNIARISHGASTAGNSETITTRCNDATLIKPFLVVIVYECGRPAELSNQCFINLWAGFGGLEELQLLRPVAFNVGVPRERMAHPSTSPPALPLVASTCRAASLDSRRRNCRQSSNGYCRVCTNWCWKDAPSNAPRLPFSQRQKRGCEQTTSSRRRVQCPFRTVQDQRCFELLDQVNRLCLSSPCLKN